MNISKTKLTFVLFLFLATLILYLYVSSLHVFGNDIPENIKEQESYFDSLIKDVIVISDSIEDIDYPDTILVDSQEGFNSLDGDIKLLLNAGSSGIIVIIDTGRYYFKERHINISEIDKPVNLKICGYGCELYGKGQMTDRLNPRYAYLDTELNENIWSGVVQFSDTISKVDGHDDVYRIHRDSSVEFLNGDYIQISQWYTSSVFQVIDVTESDIFFSTKEFVFGANKKGMDLNADYNYGKFYPRYRKFQSKLPENSVYECQASSFLSMRNTEINSLVVENIDFIGSAYDRWKGVLYFSSLRAKFVNVDGCSFTNSKNPCVSLQNTDNVKVDHCRFYDNFYNCVQSDDRCVGTVVADNFFSNNGKGWTNSFNVKLSGERFLIAHNLFRDFDYCAIGVGNWWCSKKNGLITGIIEDNEIFYTPEYYDQYEVNTLMDSGAIYVWTINDDVHVRYNRIYNIIGIKDNRGIFCDDGTCNVKIYGNLITGISNSYCIDLRYVPRVENDEKFSFGKVNIGNSLIHNIVDGKCRFEGREGDNNDCIKGENYIFCRDGNQVAKILTKNIQNADEDHFLNIRSIEDGKIVLTDSTRLLLENNLVFKRIHKWFN